METRSQDTTSKTRLEAAREAVLGSLARARETLQVAATTVPAWARDVELKAGEQADALLERVGLVRLAKVKAKTAAPAAGEPATPEATVDVIEAAAEAATEATVEAAATEAPATEEPAVIAAAPSPTPAEATHDQKGRRRRR